MAAAREPAGQGRRWHHADGELDVLVVGAGFSGMLAVHRLRELGFRVRAFERADGVGGTWHWNRYPGARCDGFSIEYSYSLPELQQEWSWSERYAAQPEILDYARFAADRLGLGDDIEFGVTITGASYDEAGTRWHVATDDGRDLVARVVVLATGPLSSPKAVDIPGAERFRGQRLMTSSWPDGVDLSGKKVAVFGTGSSGVQCITALAEVVGDLTVFQRTPNFAIPARNGAMPEEEMRLVKKAYPEIRHRMRRTPGGADRPDLASLPSVFEVDAAERERLLEESWQRGGMALFFTFSDLSGSVEADTFLADFVRRKIGELVEDPEVAAALTPPPGQLIGARRIILETGYFDCFNREHVHLVDLRRDPLVEITERGVRTESGEQQFDAIVFATGFDALTGSFEKIDPRGRGGRTLQEKWLEGPRTWLGLGLAGFPNLFTVIGPGSPSVLTNVMTSVEQHIDWIGDLLVAMREREVTTVEPSAAAEEAWLAHTLEVGAKTLFVKGRSWYMGSNVPGKPRFLLPYVGGADRYRRICDAVAAAGYPGLRFDGGDPDAAAFAALVAASSTAPALAAGNGDVG